MQRRFRANNLPMYRGEETKPDKRLPAPPMCDGPTTHNIVEGLTRRTLRFPQLFPLLATKRVVEGHVRKCREVTFDSAANNTDEYSQLRPNTDKGRCREWQFPATVDGDRIFGWNECCNHRVSLAFACPNSTPAAL
jgi:hypothetical protein